MALKSRIIEWINDNPYDCSDHFSLFANVCSRFEIDEEDIDEAMTLICSKDYSEYEEDDDLDEGDDVGDAEEEDDERFEAVVERYQAVGSIENDRS